MALTDPSRPTDIALLSDLYELTMAQGLWESGKLDELDCFTAFYRDHPFGSAYGVMCGTADLPERVENLRFTPGAAAAGVAAMRAGAVVITDTNMALAGITKPGLAKLGGQALCFMADPAVAAAAKAAGSTRAAAAMHRAAREYPGAVLAVGNAPTALLTIADEIESGLRPALVIAVPVGFVNVVESKERLFAVCTQYGVPAIAAMGRKGGSNVAAAICNALVYSAAEMLDPAARGWQ